jgi:hypothetical protein
MKMWQSLKKKLERIKSKLHSRREGREGREGCSAALRSACRLINVGYYSIV